MLDSLQFVIFIILTKRNWNASRSNRNYTAHLLPVALSVLTFKLPAESYEKMELGVTVCLLYFVTVTAIIQEVPAKEHMPLLGKGKMSMICPQNFAQSVFFRLIQRYMFT